MKTICELQATEGGRKWTVVNAPGRDGVPCEYETICESCPRFSTTVEFLPIISMKKQDAEGKGQTQRADVLSGSSRVGRKLQQGLLPHPLDYYLHNNHAIVFPSQYLLYIWVKDIFYERG
jgi:hypothetical protein